MNQSEKLDQIAPALVAAQEQLRNPRTDSKATVQTKTGGRYEYAYLSLPALLDAVRGAFKKLGLAFAQEVTGSDEGIQVTTRIVHLSGQWIDCGPLHLPARGGPQDFGSAITYGRRYSLAAAVGLAADEDDDAARVARPKASSGQAPVSTEPAQSSAPAGPPRQEADPGGTVADAGQAAVSSTCSECGLPGGRHRPTCPVREKVEASA